MKNEKYKPDFFPDKWTLGERVSLQPFATNLDGLVTVLRNLPPEIVGALCSRASRASGYLLRVFYDEYLEPILNGEDLNLARELRETIDFLNYRGFKKILNNQRAQSFYARWLAQYGDESIAQMTGNHLVFWGISQVAMKNLEDRRIGLAPIEKSTRYVDFGKKTNGKYLYYTDPDIVEAGLGDEYRGIMDTLFETYTYAVVVLKTYFAKRFPDEKPSVVEKKAFDVSRGFLPMSTLGQVAFYGNAQAFAHMINNAAAHSLGELRWIAEASANELNEEIPSLLLRLKDEKTQAYQRQLAERGERMRVGVIKELDSRGEFPHLVPKNNEEVVLFVDEKDDLEDKVISAMLYPFSSFDWEEIEAAVYVMSPEDKEKIISAYFGDRNERWQKVGRALENVYLRFEITMNAGAYRDLHRHRMHTQERQLFTVRHGYDTSPEIVDAKLSETQAIVMECVETLYEKIERTLGQEHAQYATTLFHRVRFYQFQNLRQFFWEAELRTIAQGHDDYRRIEQKKFELVREHFPIISKYMLIDMNQYDFARRDTEKKIEEKEKKILEKLK